VVGFALALRPGWAAKGNDAALGRIRFEPPALIEQASRQFSAPKLNGDDFPHAHTLAQTLAAHLSGPFSICGFLCRFWADAGAEPFSRP
jgi:hypothetical protein